MSRRICVLNNKGGVGKTLTATALAEAAARRGLWVLVVDMDPQANATRRLRATTMDQARGVARSLTTVLQPAQPPGVAMEFRVRCGWGTLAEQDEWRIDVLTADLDLEDRALEGSMPGAFMRLRKALKGVDDNYDLTIIDCPPSIKGHLSVMALASLDGADDAVVIPLTLEQDAVGGALRALQYVRLWRADLGVPQLDVAGLVVNNYRKGVALQEARMSSLDQLLDSLPILATIPLRARIAELQDAALPLSTDPVQMAPIMAEFDSFVANLFPDFSAPAEVSLANGVVQ